MKKFRVQVTICDHFFVDVEADDESTAREQACEIMAGESAPLKCEAFDHSDGFEAVGCELTDERTFTPTVMLHSFVNLEDGSHEHCNFKEGDGYNVWLRRDFTDVESSDQEPFDSDNNHDDDFSGLVSARHYARKLADEFQCEIEEY